MKDEIWNSQIAKLSSNKNNKEFTSLVEKCQGLIKEACRKGEWSCSMPAISNEAMDGRVRTHLMGVLGFSIVYSSDGRTRIDW